MSNKTGLCEPCTVLQKVGTEPIMEQMRVHPSLGRETVVCIRDFTYCVCFRKLLSIKNHHWWDPSASCIYTHHYCYLSFGVCCYILRILLSFPSNDFWGLRSKGHSRFIAVKYLQWLAEQTIFFHCVLQKLIVTIKGISICCLSSGFREWCSSS